MKIESVHNTGQRRGAGKNPFAFCQNNVTAETGMILLKRLVLHVIGHSLIVIGDIDSENDVGEYAKNLDSIVER